MSVLTQSLLQLQKHISHHALNKINQIYQTVNGMLANNNTKLLQAIDKAGSSACCLNPTGLLCIHVVYKHLADGIEPIPLEAINEQWHIAETPKDGSWEQLPMELLNPNTKDRRNKGRPPGARNKPKPSQTASQSSTKQDLSQFEHSAAELGCDVDEGIRKPKPKKRKLTHVEAYAKKQSQWTKLKPRMCASSATCCLNDEAHVETAPTSSVAFLAIVPQKQALTNASSKSSTLGCSCTQDVKRGKLRELLAELLAEGPSSPGCNIIPLGTDHRMKGIKIKPSLITRVAGDGNCGFRAVAHHVYGDQNKWSRVRESLLNQLGLCPEVYVAQAPV